MRAVALTLIAAALAACGGDGDADAVDAGAADADPGVLAWPFALPEGFPAPRLPPDGTLTPELAELGRHLFYDVRLSRNETQACASCHEQARAFSDGKPTAVGSTGDVLRRNAMSLTNVAYNPTQTWANPLADTLEQQALVPILAEHPVELGVGGAEEAVLARFAADAAYQAMFAAAFPDDPTVTLERVVAALAAFERRLVSGGSRVDRYRNGDAGALSASELRGYALFFSEELECHHCHGGFNFTIAVDHAALSSPRVHFFNTGMYNVDGTGAYPAVDQGLWEFTFEDADRGRYRPPTLRNVGVTAPYMHDGSVETLEEVVAFYERGGRLIDAGPNTGDGKLNPNKSSFVGGFVLTDEERTDLLDFLRALTDDDFLTDPTLADPFAE
jgi:cytochrome c peroxidase